MIDRKSLLTALQRWVKKFEDDLRLRCKEVPELDASLRASYAEVKKASRTAESYETWRDGQLTQAAVNWVLACVFVRFLEDNGLLDQPWIAGAGDRRTEAEHVRDRFFSRHPTLSDRDYLQHVFTEVGKLPGMADLLDRRHNPLWTAGISGDAASEFIAFWRKMDHDFTDPAWDTRFLGDLYQDLSEAARKQFALLQTPAFIEEFILDRTLEPAIETFGYERVRMIDPACGSGHFILDGFARLLRRWQSGHPELNEREVVMRALEGVAGVDINPFAVAIARFRLLLAAWRACGITRLRAAPDFRVNLAVGDSLLHGRRFREFESEGSAQHAFDTEEIFRDELKHHYEVEDPEALRRVLGQQYHVVAGNPPYITVKDRELSKLYRTRYSSCHRQYSLSVPFMERFFDLAIKGDGTWQRAAGFVGQITANSFMKRELGKKLIEEYLPRWDLTHVLDTSGAYIPGHGTPTVVLFGKNQLPVRDTLRTVLGIRGEPATPAEPAQGLVWQALCQQIDQPGSESEWVSAVDSPRANFHRHPWSIGGGGAAELKSELDQASDQALGDLMRDVGRTTHTGADEVFYLTPEAVKTRGLAEFVVPLVVGEDVRDFSAVPVKVSIFTYNEKAERFTALPEVLRRYLWAFRSVLKARKDFDQSIEERGLCWWEHSMFFPERFRQRLGITWSEVSTHNHFALDRGGRVFKQTAPVMKLKLDATEADHLRLLGVLNSSTACFWLQQVMHNKGGPGGGSSKDEKWHDFYAFNATKIAEFPLPSETPLALATELDSLARELQRNRPAAVLAESANHRPEALVAAHARWEQVLHRMVSLQEELDWWSYRAYGIMDDGGLLAPVGSDGLPIVPSIQPGERAFEILLARQGVRTKWFEWLGIRPITASPKQWPPDYTDLCRRRQLAIQENKQLSLIERPECKRRWEVEPWEAEFQLGARDWLLNRLETAFFEGERILGQQDRDRPALESARTTFPASREPRLTSTRQLADAMSLDADFLRVAALYRDREDFDLPKLVRELVEEESVPFLPAQRYKESGLRKRMQWERTWDLQRLEDEIDARRAAEATRAAGQPLSTTQEPVPEKPEVPVPPKYAFADFKKASYWRLRGKLDVPKERWILYPGAERQVDPAPVIAWAGWDHKQQAQALAGYYQERKDQDGWTAERLAPLLAGLKDLVPWMKQWHNEIDPVYGLRLGDFYEGFVRDETHALGLSEAQVEAIRIGC
jgi:hypothetical protein